MYAVTHLQCGSISWTPTTTLYRGTTVLKNQLMLRNILDLHETLPYRPHRGITTQTKWNPTFKPQSQSRDTQSTVSVSLYRYNSTLTEMPDIKMTETGVLKLLQNLKPYKAQGPNNIHQRILIELAVKIGWLKANVSPIFKNGQNTSLQITDPSP